MSTDYPPNGPPGLPPPQQPPPQPWQPAHTSPPRKSWSARHKVWTAVLSAVALIVVLVIVVGVAAKPTQTPTAASTPAASAAVTPSPTPSPTPALTARQQAFVSAMQSDFNFNSSVTGAQLVGYGQEICADRARGDGQAEQITMTEGYFSNTAASDATTMTRLAEKYLCRRYLPPPPPPTVLVSMSGSGIQNSAPFTVTSGTVTVTYSYDCSGAGGSGNFIADLETGNQASINSDDQSIANALGTGGSATTTVYPQDVGSQYHLAVNSECNWHVTITEPSS